MALPIKVIIQAVLLIIILCTASICDIRKRIIPDILSALIFCVGLLTFNPFKLLGILVGLPLVIGALLADSQEMGGIGGGDIKITAASGFVLGISEGTVGLIIGLAVFCLGFLVLKIYNKILHKPQPLASKTALPMAPFLSVGFIVAYYMNFGGLIL